MISPRQVFVGFVTAIHFFLLFLLGASALGVAWGGRVFAQESNPKRPNVVLIVSDDQRPDTISVLGNPNIRTPQLDRLVARGSVFTRAICANPICTPSRAEILTGCSGIKNGVFDFGREIDPDLPTLPEPFAQAGYKTWYSGKWHNDGRPRKHGYEATSGLYTGGGGKWWKPQGDYRGHPVTGYKGWIFRDNDDQPLPERGVGLTPDISRQIADAAINVIEESQSPYFLHVNFTAPHDPLLIPPGFEEMYDADSVPTPPNFQPEHPFDHGNRGGRDEVLLPTPRTSALVRADLAAYYAVISHLDQQVGRIVDAIDARGDRASTIVVFCSDHGLAMGSHGLRGKQNMYEHTIGVPMILAGPGIPAGQSLSGQIYLRDIFPTLLELADLPAVDCDGVSQVPVLRGQRETMHEFVVGYFRDSQRMIRGDRWKWIEYPIVGRAQLFDLHADPFERNDVSGDPRNAAVVTRLAKQLNEWMREQEAGPAQASAK